MGNGGGGGGGGGRDGGGLAWALVPLALGMLLFAYWLLVVRVYLSRVREAAEAAAEAVNGPGKGRRRRVKGGVEEGEEGEAGEEEEERLIARQKMSGVVSGE